MYVCVCAAFALGFSEMRWKTQRGRKNAYDNIKMHITPKQNRTFHGMRIRHDLKSDGKQGSEGISLLMRFA